MPSEGTGRGQPFEGPASEMKESDWLTVEDMQASGRAHVDLTIARVLVHKNVQFEKGRTEAKKYALAFKGAGKQLIINATNRKRLVGMFGGNTKDWIGKRVRLHLEEDKMPAGGRAPCTRIIRCPDQPAAPRPEPTPPVQPEPGAYEEEQGQLDVGSNDGDWTKGLD